MNTSPIDRTCPRCKAGPGEACRRHNPNHGFHAGRPNHGFHAGRLNPIVRGGSFSKTEKDKDAESAARGTERSIPVTRRRRRA